MSCQDAAAAPRRAAGRKAWLLFAVSVASVAAIGFTVRSYWGPLPASAQAPARQQARPAGPATARVADNGAGRPAAPAAGAPKQNTLPLMAVVNGEQITREQLGHECLIRYGTEVLESMTNRQLIVEACNQRNIKITEQDVNEEVDRIASKFGLSRDRWLVLLREERGYTDAQYRNEVVWPMLALRRVAADSTEVSQDELKKAFESEFGAKVRVRMIGVSAQAKAEKIRAAAAANPETFGDLAKQECEDPSVAAAYGVIPPVRRHVGDPNLEAIAFALQPGEISRVIPVANQYYILKCEQHLPQQFVSSQDMPKVQEQLSDRIKEGKLRSSAMTFFDTMQKQAKIVNVLNNKEMQAANPGVAATVNGRPITMQQLAEECMSRHGREVLEGEVNRKVLLQELARRKLVVNTPDIDEEVARAAESYGFNLPGGGPDVKRWLEEVTSQDGATIELYVRDAVWPSVALKKLVGNRVSVTDEDMKKGFESNYGERVEVLAIVLSDQRQAQKVWEMARNNPSDTFFASMAQEYSVEPASRSNGGKVPPIRRYGGSPRIEEEAFKLKRGELSGIVASGEQYIIMRCMGRTTPVQVDFAAVKAELQKDISEKKLRALMGTEFDNLRSSAKIENLLAGTSQSGKRPAVGANGVAPAGGPGAMRGPGQVSPATATRPLGPALPAKR